MVNSPKALIGLSQQEEAKEGSTYLSLLDPNTRARVTEAATNRQKSIENDAYIQQERQRHEVERMDAQLSADVKGYFLQMLNDPKTNGTPTQQYLDLALQVRGVTPEDYHTLSNMLKAQTMQGGPGDPVTMRRLQSEVYNSAIPAATRLAHLNAAWDNGKLDTQFYRMYAGELQTKAALGEIDPATGTVYEAPAPE